MAEPPGALKEKVLQTPIPKRAKDVPVKINLLERKLEQLFKDSLSTNQKKSEAAAKEIENIEVDALPFLIKKLSNEKEAPNAFFIAAQILDARNEFGKPVYYNEMYFKIALDGLAVVDQLNEKIQNGSNTEKAYARLLRDKIPVVNVNSKTGALIADMLSGDPQKKAMAEREIKNDLDLSTQLVVDWNTASPSEKEAIAGIFTDDEGINRLMTAHTEQNESTIQEIVKYIGRPAAQRIQGMVNDLKIYGAKNDEVRRNIRRLERIMEGIKSNQQ